MVVEVAECIIDTPETLGQRLLTVSVGVKEIRL